MGILDPNSSRSVLHTNKMKQNLLHDGYGLARHDGDIFYYKSPWNPGGNEALSDEPTWPQMSMYMALYHAYRGEKPEAYNYLKWFVSRTGVGYMAPGEAVSRIDMKPLISTAVEPVTAAWYIIAALAYEGQADAINVSNQYNAGFSKSISVNGSKAQWKTVPYFLDARHDATSDSLDIERVYLSNDENNVYIRVKTNQSNILYPKIALDVYAQDVKNGKQSSKSNDQFGKPLNRSAHYFIEFKNDGKIPTQSIVNHDQWVMNHEISGGSTMKYESTLGEYVVSIPWSELSSTGEVKSGDWTQLMIELAYEDHGIYHAADSLGFHYRYTTNESGIYGNIE